MLTLAILLGCLPLVGIWEFCRPRRRRDFPAVRRRLGNIGFWVLNLVLAAFLLEPPVQARPRIEAVFGAPLPAWPIADAGLSLIAGFLLLDLLRYLVHRCEHAVPLFWRFHALHHSDPDVDVTTSVRHHPMEYLVASAVYWFAVILLDIPAVVVLSHGLAVFGTAAVQHGNICLPERMERWLQPVLVTVDMHRMHHSIAFEQANSNYGAVLSVWDRLFGTCASISHAQHERIVFGVRDLPRPDCLKLSAMFLTPWRIARARAVESRNSAVGKKARSAHVSQRAITRRVHRPTPKNVT